MEEQGKQNTETTGQASAAASAAPAGTGQAAGPEPPGLRDEIVKAIATCYDPEIPVNIYELGLVYDVLIDAEGAVTVRMTLTSPSCPAAESLPGDVERKVRSVAGVKDVKIELVWEPQWHPSMMSEAARLQLGILY